MTGKEKCKLLRQIRKEVAANNDIPYFPTECTYEGDDCVGSCPMCEAEATYLDKKLNEKAAAGAAITLRGISMETFREHCPEPVPADPIPMVEAGVMVCDDQPGKPSLDLPIEDLHLPTECLNSLKNVKIHTIGQLIQKSQRELNTVYRIPMGYAIRIRKTVEEAGLSMKEEPIQEPIMGVPIPWPDTPGVMAPVDEHRPAKVREKGALRPRDLRRMKDELEIMKLGLSSRTLQILVSADIKTISQLISLSTEDLRKLDGISKKHMEEIIKKVHDAGLYFKGENQWVDF